MPLCPSTDTFRAAVFTSEAVAAWDHLTPPIPTLPGEKEPSLKISGSSAKGDALNTQNEDSLKT